jgi:hypothetical protein
MGVDQPFQSRRHIVAVACGAHVFVNLENPAVGADIKRPPRRKPDRSKHPVRPRRRLGRIAQNRKLEAERPRELRVLVRRVDACREIRDVESPERVAARPERLALCRSPARERFWKPRDDDRPLADVITQPIYPLIRSLQLEIGRDVARLKVNRALEQPQRMSSVSCHSSKALDIEDGPWCTFFCREVSFSKSTDLSDRLVFDRVNGL